MADPDNLALEKLDVHGASFTFVLPEGIGDGDAFMEVAGAADVDEANLYMAGPGLEGLRADDEVTLIDAGTLSGTPAAESGEAPLGATRLIGFSLNPDGSGNLKSVFGDIKANPQAKALSEGQLGGSVFINQAGDLMADSGIANARLVSSYGAGPAMFTAMSYGDYRYETGSHVDVRGLSVLLGAAYGIEAAPGRFTLGAFFEYGTGSYDTFNDFANYASVKGEGDTDYYGGGLLGRLDIGHGSGSTYVEVSARVGRVSADFMSRDFGPAPVAYDASSAYYGIHAGLGHVFNLSDSASLDLYGKYFLTHQEGKSVTAPDPVTFGDVNSHRVRAGAKLTRNLTDTVGMYFGAAYEREFAGKAEAVSRGMALDVPKLRGDSGMGELGLNANVGENVNLDFGLQGYAGDRKGVSGSVRLNVMF